MLWIFNRQFIIRSFLAVIFLVILSGASDSRAATPYCGKASLTQALQFIDWQQKNTYYNQMVRQEALNDSLNIRSAAKAMALSSTFVFLLSISLLAAAITYRALEHAMMSALLGALYFVFFSLVFFTSREPIENITREFRE